MQNGFNPVRRNRNIGTDKSGYKKQNDFQIPNPNGSSCFENINQFNIENRNINGRTFHFIIENLKRSYIYSCSVDDVAEILKAVPSEDLIGLDCIVFRQPKRKEEIFSKCWGRIIYNYNFNKTVRPAIIIEAVDISKDLKMDKSLNPFDNIELETLREEGHLISESKKFYIIKMTKESVRNTQLYRTIFHEVGHYVDYKSGMKRNELEKEVFANNYAKKIKEKIII